jgi:hypothetical protein
LAGGGEGAMKFPLLEDTLDILCEHGLVGEVEEGPHFKVRFTNPLGRQCTLIVSRSPSCRLASKKNKALLRRLLRAPAIASTTIGVRHE